MSKHYSAFQYDAAYKPTALRNWEVPKYVCQRPRQRTGRTNIIANAMGNLLPGVHRSEDSPWGNFIGTWSMPRKIDRNVAATMNGSADFKMKAHKCYLHYTSKPVQRQENEEPKDEPQAESKPKVKAEKVTDVKIQEENNKAEELGSVEPQEESQIDQGKLPAEEEEIVIKPLCPIHDVVING